MLEKLIEEAKSYEAGKMLGKMLREDSEVEIDILEDIDEPGIYVSDYSEERGDAEPVKRICGVGDIAEDDIVAVCDKYGWAYCL